MFYSGKSHNTGSVNPIFIRILRGNNTISGKENRAIKALNLFLLFPPGVPIIAYKMGILFKGRIIVGREHLTMSVYIYSAPLSLF
ncbi:hypothetical protein ES705_51124 [subsurface metagenome]